MYAFIFVVVLGSTGYLIPSLPWVKIADPIIIDSQTEVKASKPSSFDPCCNAIFRCMYFQWGVGGALVESTPFVRRVMGSTPALAATKGAWASNSLTVVCGASE